MNSEKNSTTLAGVRPLRIALGLTRPRLAELAGVHRNTIYTVETGERTGSLSLLGTLARCLCCEPADLLSEPTQSRLTQIKADFDEARAKESRAAADQAAGRAVGL